MPSSTLIYYRGYATNATGTGYSASSSFTTTAPAQPDLTAASATPSTATAGTALTFSSTISNIGTAGTGASFSNFFQVATAAGGGGTITDLASSTMAALANGASATATSPSYTFASSGTYSARACADKTNSASAGTIAESNEGNNCGAWTNVTVGSAPAPDLTASTPPESTATAGVAQVFTSTISNSGTASTGASFTNLFQTSTVSDGSSGVVDYPVSPVMSALAAGANAGTSKSITFSSAGTIYIRACADKSSAADVNGVIVESNEGNNCSMSTPWKSVTVVNAPLPAPVVSISASPASGTVNVVNPALTWSATNSPTSCTASGDWSGVKPTSGTNVSQGILTAIRTYTYTLVCSNADGSSLPKSAAVVVTGGEAMLTASSTSIYSGDSITLTWSCPVADTSASGTNFSTGGAPSGSISVGPPATTTYILTCGPSGATAQVTVIVRKKPFFQE